MRTMGVRWGYGAGTGVRNLDALRDDARWAEAAGFDGLWVSQVFGVDPIVALAAIADDVPNISELGTSVVPLTGRHPMSLAPAALTAQAASRGRFTLGIGPSHQVVVEGLFGESYARPFTRTREFVTALNGLFYEGSATVQGEEISSAGWLTIEAPPVPILLAALGPRMLELAGSATAGTSLGSCGPTTIRNHIRPRIVDAAERAGRGAPRIMALVEVSVTDRPEERRAASREAAGGYDALPAYRAMLDREGVASGADLAVFGTADQVAEGLAAYVDAGATDLRVLINGDDDERAATRGFFEELLG